MTLVSCQRSVCDTVIDVLIPAYANPCCGGGPNLWSSLIASAGMPGRNFELHAIFNPASGPGSGVDRNYISPGGTGPLPDFRAAGGITHGDVATNYGNRPISEVKADIDACLTGRYAGFVDGIFLDEMSNDLAKTACYQELHMYVQSLHPGARTIGNPGTTFVVNPSNQNQFSATDCMNALDTVMTFESRAEQYTGNYTSFPYLEGLDRPKVSHVVHTLAQWDSSLLSLASSRGAGFLYVTDDVFLDPSLDNPYDRLA